MKLKFENITISGGVAVGKNTLRDNLMPYLKPYGWRFKSSGQIVRDYLNEYLTPHASWAPEKLHKEIDNKVQSILKTEKLWVIEAWLAGWLARQFSNCLRVLLICSNKALQVDRVANRDKVTIEQAKQFVKEREEDNLRTFNKIYDAVDIFSPKNYHLVIDTYSTGPLETVGKVLDALGYDHKKIEINKVLPKK